MAKIRNYEFQFDEQGYLTSFQSVLTDDCDFTGQMADYPDVLDSLPEGWYKFENGEFVLDSERKEEVLAKRQAEEEKPTFEDKIEAQMTYTAMMTDTLIEE